MLEISDPKERKAVLLAQEKVRYLGRAPRVIATSPACVDICDRLELDLVGVGHSALFATPERYEDATEVGPPMSPDMEIVGSLIFWKGMAFGASGEQRVSPIWISVIPEMATMEPMPASFTSTLFRPSNS